MKEPRTLLDLFYGSVALGKSSHLRFKRDGAWRDVSSDYYRRAVEELAMGLLALGIEKGDRIAILSENRPEWAYADLASLAIGAIDVPIYPNLTSEQVLYLLGDSESTVRETAPAQDPTPEGMPGGGAEALAADGSLPPPDGAPEVPTEESSESQKDEPAVGGLGTAYDEALALISAAADETARSLDERIGDYEQALSGLQQIDTTAALAERPEGLDTTIERVERELERLRLKKEFFG